MSDLPPILFASGIPADTVAWSEPPSTVDGAEGVHLWRLSLSRPATRPEQTLSADELERAGRFHLPVHRERFVAGRALLRAVLARYVGGAPAAIWFEYGPFGKPRLSGPRAPEFNLTHADDLALLAVCRDRPVGIDLERLDRPLDHAAIAAQFFDPADARQVAEAPSTLGPETFCRIWTRREAVFKARGVGLSGLTRPAAAAGASDAPGFAVHTFVPDAGFIASLALPGAAAI